MRPDPHWFDDLPSDRLLAEISLWSADLMNMGADLARLDPWTDLYHLDVADGHFSPACLIFPDQAAAARKLTARPFHVHLMVADAILLAQIDQFAEAGADLVSVHAENGNWEAGLERIRGHGLRAGIVAQLDTPIEALRPAVPHIDVLTLLGTRIGVKGQSLDVMATTRLREAAALIADAAGDRRIVLAADGGIRDHTVPDLHAAGAETVVMGSLAFGAPDLAARMTWIRAQAKV